MPAVDLTRPGVWSSLFPHALRLMRHLEHETRNPLWTFGGGTVLMLRIHHRQSKDIDLFIPDPQYLGYINPRLSDVAESITTDYEENAEFLKLFLPEGEIDIVVGRSLTENPFELIDYGGHALRVETSAEIVAKKMWHRGDRAKARDLFDLCAVHQADPEAIQIAAPFMCRHGADFLRQIVDRADVLRRDFEAIDVIDFCESYENCVLRAQDLLNPILQGRGTPSGHDGPISAS